MRQRKLKRTATLNALKSRINPHFLYNTLGCIRNVAKQKQAYDIAEMTSALTDLFRYSIKDGDFSTVSEEIDIVTQYMIIMQYRFNGKFKLQIEIEDAVFHMTIPKMIIQPLVENAITHGLETSEDKGMITIKGHQFDNYMILSVSDNGKGVSAQKLKLLKDNLNSSGKVLPNSIGLVNVNERIKLYHGDGYGLEINISDAGGFCVDIKLPH